MNFNQIIACSMFFMITCKAPQKTQEETKPQAITTSSTTTATADNASATPDQPMQNSKDTRYRFIVSFISIGGGTDLDAKRIFDATLNELKASSKKDIPFEEVHWGREGEVDLCFPLAKMNDAEQAEFIQQIRDKLKGNELVQFAENEPCNHKR